jgi:hypothetical protein
MALVLYPRTREAEAEGSKTQGQPGVQTKTVLKKKKAQYQWLSPVIPASWEAETRKSQLLFDLTDPISKNKG